MLAALVYLQQHQTFGQSTVCLLKSHQHCCCFLEKKWLLSAPYRVEKMVFKTLPNKSHLCGIMSEQIVFPVDGRSYNSTEWIVFLVLTCMGLQYRQTSGISTGPSPQLPSSRLICHLPPLSVSLCSKGALAGKLQLAELLQPTIAASFRV